MTQTKAKLLVALLFFISGISQATEPSACRAIEVPEGIVRLSTKEPTIVLIHNVSSSQLWITHPTKGNGAEAGWSSALSPKHWSALTLDKKNFVIQCIESIPGHEQQVPCKGLLNICQWPKIAKLKPSNKGTYWADEDKPLTIILRNLTTKGFKPVADKNL